MQLHVVSLAFVEDAEVAEVLHELLECYLRANELVGVVSVQLVTVPTPKEE